MHLLRILNDLLWQWILPLLLVITALCCGRQCGWRPLWGFSHMLRTTYGTLLQKQMPCAENKPSQRQIFATALAATMGTGNLVGTAAAISLGGAGALFWMWISALLGMLLVYAENVLGIHFRRKNGIGGTLAYLHEGIGSVMLTVVFAICCVGASLGMGNLAQSNALASALKGIGIPLPCSALITVFLSALILWGGAKRIGRVTEWLMPLLCGGYLLGCGILLSRHIGQLPTVLLQILREALGIRAVGGGIAASALLHSMSIGIRRGIFSNEAGLGSSALLHMEAEGDPQQQGNWAAAEVFADTVLCCTATALVLLTTLSPTELYGSSDGAALLLRAFSSGFGQWAAGFLAVCIALLAFATLIGWYRCGLAAFRFLFGTKQEDVFCLLYLLTAFAGALGRAEWVWLLCDLCNGCMALPNCIGLLRLLPMLRQLHPTAAVSSGHDSAKNA